MEDLVQLADRDAMGPMKVPHRRIAARLDNSDHRLVVFMHHQPWFMWQNGLPEVETRYPTASQRVAGSDNLRLGCGVGNTTLAFAHAANRE